MPKFAFFLIVAVALLLTGCSDGQIGPEVEGDLYLTRNYPYTIYAKTPDEVAQLQDEFNKLNNGRICTELDAFGLTGHTDPCIPDNPVMVISDQTEIIQIAKATLLKNAASTNVTDTSQLHIRQIMTIDESPIRQKITFDDQVYHGYPVDRSDIVVFYYGDHVYRIGGYWYHDIPMPGNLRLSVTEAQQNLISLQFDFYCWYPVKIMIARGMIIDSLTAKYIFPIKNEKSIELRFTYRFAVSLGQLKIPEFYIFVNAFTDQIIEIRPLIIC